MTRETITETLNKILQDKRTFKSNEINSCYVLELNSKENAHESTIPILELNAHIALKSVQLSYYDNSLEDRKLGSVAASINPDNTLSYLRLEPFGEPVSISEEEFIATVDKYLPNLEF